MSERQYKYDAFISYRHCELDKYVAENLHRILETYELPKSIKKRLGVSGKAFKRIFRDQEELPLSSNLEDPIIEALKDSKYLIVICSPRLKDSLWCKKEIETFKKLRGRKSIFCVLVEGEPNESFPEEVCFDEVITKDKKGKEKIEMVPVEPLAADVRGKSKSEVLKRIKDEKLRLVAPMYNLDYDDLKQRHKIRRQKQIMYTSLIIAVASILFAIYSLAMFIKINTQSNILATHQALSLANQSQEYLKKDSRYDAVKSAYEALTEFEDVKMPYTADAEYALAESLGVYDIGSSYKAITEVKTDGIASYIKTSDDNKYAAVYDESYHITLFDTKQLRVINKYKVNGIASSDRSYTFIGNDKLAYITDEGNIAIVNINDGKEIKTINKIDNKYSSIIGSSNGTYLSYIDGKNLYIYNINEDREIGIINSNDKYMKELYYSADSEYLFTYTTKDTLDFTKKDFITLHVIKLNEAKELNSKTFEAGYISGVMTKDNNAYLLLNNSPGTKYNMLVISYNYLTGKVNWSNTYENAWGKLINRSYPEGTNNIAVVNYQTIRIINASNGKVVDQYNADSEIIDIYSYYNKEIYMLFLSKGHVNYINQEYKNNIEYKGRFILNLPEYTKVAIAENGFLLIPTNENRVILYEENFNKDMKEEEQVEEYKDENRISLTDYDGLKEEYNVLNKSLVNNMFYGKNNELLFVNYANEDVSIYSTKDKKLLKTINKVGKVDKYYGEDSKGRMYIGDGSDSYIINKEYEKVGHIKGLCRIENDRAYIYHESKYYSIKLYTLDELKQIAKDYLGE